MSKTVFAILATTALLSTGILATRAEAMTPAPLGVAAPNTDLAQQARVVCGPRGCVRRPLWNRWGGGWGGGWRGASGPFNPCPQGFTVQGGRCQPYRWGW